MRTGSGTRPTPTQRLPTSELRRRKVLGATHHRTLVRSGLLLPLAVFVAVVGPIVSGDAAAGWDRELADRLYRETRSRHDEIDHLLRLGDVGGTALLILLVGGLAIRGRRSTAFVIAATTAGVLALDLLANALLGDVELDPPNNATFTPSGHAMASVAVAGSVTLALSTKRYRAAVAALGAIAVAGYGVAVVARNWHYPSEVIAGWSLALAWLAALWWVAAWLGERRSSAPSPPPRSGPCEVEQKIRSTRE
jgi:membrane-associated phospholipid phosphatase